MKPTVAVRLGLLPGLSRTGREEREPSKPRTTGLRGRRRTDRDDTGGEDVGVSREEEELRDADLLFVTRVCVNHVPACLRHVCPYVRLRRGKEGDDVLPIG